MRHIFYIIVSIKRKQFLCFKFLSDLLSFLFWDQQVDSELDVTIIAKKMSDNDEVDIADRDKNFDSTLTTSHSVSTLLIMYLAIMTMSLMNTLIIGF